MRLLLNTVTFIWMAKGHPKLTECRCSIADCGRLQQSLLDLDLGVGNRS